MSEVRNPRLFFEYGARLVARIGEGALDPAKLLASISMDSMAVAKDRGEARVGSSRNHRTRSS
jgi:hypothetical protein